ncbi:hypothetical protein [Clostridium polynesiense]|uniref:hypothetical protein n=1 Tax=Clostridium polynesiense TaxID=1325933 RepID=UPI00058EEE7D|nr:hypothetical protein [Clostridium polynesiense]
MNKKIFLSIAVIGLLISCLIGFSIYNNPNNDTKKTATKASILKIKNLQELKNSSDLIAEITVTDKQEKRDYKEIQVDVITVKINEIIKGKTDLKELKILQDSSADTIIQNGQNLLIFLKKGIDNPDCYVPVGGGQGIYIIENTNSNLKSSNSITTLKPQSLENKEILKDLTGNYNDIKQTLK